jgi:VWFA-related protein
VLLLLAWLAQASPGAPAFKSGSTLAVLHVSVVDPDAGFVPGLPREAFTVAEDGRPQTIAFFDNDDTPVTVGLVVDGSGSMSSRHTAVVQAGMAFADSSRPDDEMFTICFNEQIWRGLDDVHGFTSDRDQLRRALSRCGARGETALFDAIHAGLTQLDGGVKTRHVLIVISDGGDNASHVSFDRVLGEALRRDVVIYGIGVYDRDDATARPRLLRELAAATGGEAFFPSAVTDVRPVLERIARDIRSSYTIGYVPPPDAGGEGVRKVRVTVHPPDQRKLAVRTRSAYVKDAQGPHDDIR